MKLTQVPVMLLCLVFLLSCKSIQPNRKKSITYRNLFSEAGYSKDSIDHKIQSTFTQLFFGDKEREAICYFSGRNQAGELAYILDVNNNDVRSEGMSYGMMIAVQMDKKELFNALWNWSKTYMYHGDSAHPAFGYFAWSLKTSGVANDEMPAPDGEGYFATALYFAAARWGNGTGIYHYKKEAGQLVSQMKNRKQITGLAMGRKMTGLSLFDSAHAMVRFTTNLPDANHTDASYHLPAFYEVWAANAPQDDQAFWKRAADSSRSYLQKAAHPLTGLTPDYGNFDGSPWAAPWRAESATFSYDAWRSAMNWSVDWSWWKKDAAAIERSNRILVFFKKQGMVNYGNQYSLEGKMLAGGQPVGLLACNATVALAADQGIATDFIHAFWKCNIPTGRYRYYDSMLMMMGLLHCSGNFKVYL